MNSQQIAAMQYPKTCQPDTLWKVTAQVSANCFASVRVYAGSFNEAMDKGKNEIRTIHKGIAIVTDCKVIEQNHD